ncbi:MAG: hypothetical protein HYW34_03810 [Candidatus Brennerbacteria bacterium]|nr:hypothetical protein [Candidatus Brennerbacteria bacterium]
MNKKLFLKFVFSVLFLTLTVSQNSHAVELLSAPVISVAPTVYYPLDEALYLEGRAAPKNKIELYFEKSASQPIRIQTEANSNGEWYIGQKLELASGEWTVRARAIEGENLSDWSNPRIIRSVVSGFVLGSLKIKYLPVFIVLLLVSLLVAALLIYSFLRVRNIRRLEYEREFKEKTNKLEKALREKDRESAKVLIEENFASLRRGLMEELGHLEIKLREGAGLSKEEEEHRENLLRELRQAQENIEQKIKNV